VQFNYENRIFSTPVISPCIVEQGIEELEWVLERGAKAILVRPAPVPGLRGSRSFGLPEFDPFWARVAEADIVVGMHSSDSGYSRYTSDWTGRDVEMLPFQPQAFSMLTSWRPVEDAVSALICHGALSRFPTLKIAVIENGSSWVEPLLKTLKDAYKKMPQDFPRTRSRSSRATSTSARSGKRTWRSWRGSSARTTCCSVRTTRIPRAWVIRSATSTSSRVNPRSSSARSWVATWRSS